MPNSAATGPLEFYKNRFEIENNLTRDILNAIPSDKIDYRPHERSPSTGQIAWTLVRGLYIRVDMASKGTSEVILDSHPELAEICERFEDASRRHAAQLESWSETAWARIGHLRIGDRIALERPVTSSGCSISTRSIIVASFPPICVQWVLRCHRFMDHRAIQRLSRNSRGEETKMQTRQVNVQRWTIISHKPFDAGGASGHRQTGHGRVRRKDCRRNDF